MPTAEWLDWYQFQNERACQRTGQAFEDHAARVLEFFHDDFTNPVPAGSRGDGGSDGLAEAGTICYACYGSRAIRDVDRKLKDKLESDFARAYDVYKSFKDWRFLTNVAMGTESLKALNALQAKHENDPTRPVALRHWSIEKFWFEVASRLSVDRLNHIFPGRPGIANVELADLIPLLEALGSDDLATLTTGTIGAVPFEKMDYNGLPAATKMEFNAGRVAAPRIDQWFSEVSDPELYDRQAARFKEIYKAQLAITRRPEDILERMYVSLGGSNFRYEHARANAVYAVTSYFFDACHIFEEPPVGYRVGDPGAFADEGH